MKRRQSRTIRRSRRIAMQRKRRNRRSSVGEIFNLTPGKAENENDTLAARSAEQLGEAAAYLHDQQSRRKARKGKTKTGRRTKKTKGKKGTTERKEDKHSGRRVGDSYWEDPAETPRKSLVRLFDGSGGSTPQTRSSEEEPDTDDRGRDNSLSFQQQFQTAVISARGSLQAPWARLAPRYVRMPRSGSD